MLTRILRRLRKYLRSFVPSEEEKRFIEVNRDFWKRYWPAGDRQESTRYVLIEASENPIINLCNASFGAIVCHARHLRPIYLLNGLRDRSTRRVLESYHPDAYFVSTTSLRYLLARFWVLFLALQAWSTLRTPRDILDFRVDGIRFGDIIYDNTLMRGYATVKVVDHEVLLVLYAFYMHRYMINDIIRRYRLDSFVVAHTIGMYGGTFTRYLVRNEIEVINRIGSHEIVLKKYQATSDIGFYPAKPEAHYFKLLMDLPDDVVIPLADHYLDERHNQNVRHLSVELAFSKTKRLFETSEEFCEHYTLDPAKSTVFVMLHAFNDHPHSHFATPMYFRDYFDWFEQTLEIAKTVPSVNWIFKEHPGAGMYTTRDVDLDNTFAHLDAPHIRFLNRNADFNALSIRYVANAIVTCLGTAGMEYACLGIPCILAGEAPYSGFGFTAEPGSLSEYANCLRTVDKLPRLSIEQIKAAKVVTFFELPLIHSQRYLFCPYYEFKQIHVRRPDAVLSDFANVFSETSLDALEAQITALKEFITNPHYTQYINVEKYPFMQPAVPVA